MNHLLLLLPVWAVLGAQEPGGAEPVIRPKLTKSPGVELVLKPKLTLPEIKDAERKDVDLWIIDEFRALPPRMITVDVPGQGRRLHWYLVYRVTNQGQKQRPFVPNFTFVDDKGRRHLDTIIPKAQRAIQDRHNPLLPLENSVTAIRRGLDPNDRNDWLQPPIDESDDPSINGVAIWEAESKPGAEDGIDSRLNSFDILVRGLSNGFKLIEDPATGKVTRQYKTLRLRFKRPGDEFHQNEREIRYDGHEWLYQ